MVAGNPSNVVPGSTAPVDLEVLGRLMGNPPPEHLHRMLATFWEAESDTPVTLRKLAEARDGRALAGAAHGAKGAATCVGAHAAADLCKALEKSAKRHDWTGVATLTTQVEQAYAEIGAFIRRASKS
jgi:HPt (histidine-containing phosphotransfer) domain-containing protein